MQLRLAWSHTVAENEGEHWIPPPSTPKLWDRRHGRHTQPWLQGLPPYQALVAGIATIPSHIQGSTHINICFLRLLDAYFSFLSFSFLNTSFQYTILYNSYCIFLFRIKIRSPVNRMKLRLIAFVLILWTETLADQSPGTSIVFVYFYLGKMNIFMLYQTLI